jgi:ribonucleotide reductase beta subunit family protein with ferritin-like domain
MDPILDPKYNTPSLIVRFKDIYDAYNTHEAAFWRSSEINFIDDLKDWNEKMTKDEKHFIKMILAFFAASDFIVLENLAERFEREVQIPEARLFYSFQKAMENIHSITYSLLVTTYIKDIDEQLYLLNAVENIPCVKKKSDWAHRWIESSNSFSERLVAFAIVEGIFFSGAFCAIYWLKQSGRLPGLGMANDFIARDEGLHVDFAVLLYTKYVINKVSPDRIKAIFEEAVEIECEFITDSLPCQLIGMNATQMKSYIRFCANRLLKQLNHDNHYQFDNAEQPFSFMDAILLKNKSNFFEGRPTEYGRAGAVTDDTFDDL